VESRIDTAVAAEHEQRITVADVARLIECKVADVIKAGYEHCSFFGTANQEVSAEGAVLLARWTLHAGNHDWKEGS
jgi:flavin reductase (DIM6/NTAB) family NADH-FMN oxidoreductase RutF